jgi:hypothetical protein
MTFIRDPTLPTVTALRQFLTVHPEIDGTKRTALYHNSPPVEHTRWSSSPAVAPWPEKLLRAISAPKRKSGRSYTIVPRKRRDGNSFLQEHPAPKYLPLAQMLHGGASMAMPNYAHPDGRLLVRNDSTHGGEC